MLEKILLLLGPSAAGKEAILTLLIEQATNEAKNITHTDDVGPYENIIVMMVIYNFNRLGTEGLEGEGYMGVSFSYATDYPESIIRQLKPHRRVRTV